MAGSKDAPARWKLLMMCLLQVLPAQADWKMPSMTNVKLEKPTTTACNVCGTVTPPAVSAAVNAVKTTTPSAAALTPEPAQAVAPAPLPSPAALGPPAPAPSPVVASSPTPAPPSVGDLGGDSVSSTLGPIDPKHVSWPLVGGLAAGGAVLTAGIIAGAVVGSQKIHSSKDSFLSANQPTRLVLPPAPPPVHVPVPTIPVPVPVPVPGGHAPAPTARLYSQGIHVEAATLGNTSNILTMMTAGCVACMVFCAVLAWRAAKRSREEPYTCISGFQERGGLDEGQE